MYSIDKIRDNRSEGKARWDYHTAKNNEKAVMDQIIIEDRAYRGRENSSYEFIDPKEAFNDGKFHTSPDVWYTNGVNNFTFEIKFSTTGTFRNNCVYVKPGAIYSMLNNKDLFPNGYLLVSTKRAYAKLSASKTALYPLEVIDEWSTQEVQKKGFIIPVDHFEWEDWSVGIGDHK